MNQLYKKSELAFSIISIVIYVVTLSFADNISKTLGVEKLITAIISAVLTIIFVIWMKKNELFHKYGLCKSEMTASQLLYYIPLVIIISVNLWFGVRLNYSITETVFFVISMIFVGFLEEIIFRGFLFTSLSKNSVNTAILVSSVTFGMGHIVNLINGSGANVFSNLLQVVYATAVGFLFTIIFYKSKSLWPCIITHSLVNALSAISNNGILNSSVEIIITFIWSFISIFYAIYIIKIEDVEY